MEEEIRIRERPLGRITRERGLNHFGFRLSAYFLQFMASGVLTAAAYQAWLFWPQIWSGQGEGGMYRLTVCLSGAIGSILYASGAVVTLLCDAVDHLDWISRQRRS